MQTGKIQRVVIVESDPVGGRGQQAIVENYCASAMVHHYRNIREATACLRIYNSVPIDLVLMDHQLYRNGGRTLIGSIARRAAQWVYDPVMILTVPAVEARCVDRAGLSSFISDYLSKPVVPEFLQYLLEFHFEREGVNAVKPISTGPDVV